MQGYRRLGVQARKMIKEEDQERSREGKQMRLLFYMRYFANKLKIGWKNTKYILKHEYILWSRTW